MKKLPKIKIRWIVIAVVIFGGMLGAFFLCSNRLFFSSEPASTPAPYPKEGEAQVVDKFVDTTGYHIVIDQLFDMTTEQLLEENRNPNEGLFSLNCTKEQYASVTVGDVINASRDVFAQTHTGTLVNIRIINGEYVG